MKAVHYIVIVLGLVFAFGPPIVAALGPKLPTQWAGLAPSVLAVVAAIYVKAREVEAAGKLPTPEDNSHE